MNVDYDTDDTTTAGLMQLENLMDKSNSETLVTPKMEVVNTSFFDNLLVEMRNMRSSMNELRQLVTSFLLEKSNTSSIVTLSEVIVDKNDFVSMNVTDLEIFNGNQSVLNSTKSPVMFLDVVYRIINDTNSAIINFFVEIGDNPSKIVQFSLVVIVIAFFLCGTCVLLCKHSCCKRCCKKQKKHVDVESVALREPIIHTIEKPILLHTTNKEVLVNRAEVIGNIERSPKRLERTSSFSNNKPTFSTFGKLPPVPIRTSSLPNTPNLRKRKTVSFPNLPDSVANTTFHINIGKETIV